MNSNNAVSLGVAVINKDNQATVEANASCHIRTIITNRSYIAANNKAIENLKVEHSKLAEDIITQKQVLGAEFSGPLNPNQQTIANAIAALNTANQDAVKVKSQGFINQIKSLEASNAQYQKAVDANIEALSKLSVDVVTVEQVVPSSK